MDGYIKLYRKLIKSPVFQNEKLLKIWIWCLCNASHSDIETIIGLQKVTIEKGQFVFGLLKASRELDIPKSTLDRNMKALQKFGMINIKPGTKYSIVTIENWRKYQGVWEESGTNVENKRETNGKQTETNKNVKNDKNVKNNIINNILSDVDPDLQPVLKDFLEMRKLKKSPMTPKALELLIQKLKKLAGDDIALSIAILEQSIQNSWTGVYELKNEKVNENANNGPDKQRWGNLNIKKF